MKSIFLMPDSDPVRNYSLNFKDQKEESRAKNRPILASRRLVQPMFQILPATRKLAQTLSAFFLHKRFFQQKEPFLRTMGKWKVIHAHSPDGGDLAIAVSKMVTRIGASYDQDERQSDGSMHWDTIRPVLLKAFAKHGARDVSEKYWFFLIHEGSSKARIEYCEDSTKSIANFRAIQGHSGGIPIDPELMGYVGISDDCKKYFDHRGCSVSNQSILEA